MRVVRLSSVWSYEIRVRAMKVPNEGTLDQALTTIGPRDKENAFAEQAVM